MSNATNPSVDRWLRGAPPEIADFIRAAVADADEAKRPIIAALRASGRTDLSAESLRGKSLSDLRVMAALAQVTPTGDTPEAPRFFTGPHREAVERRDPEQGPGFFTRRQSQERS